MDSRINRLSFIYTLSDPITEEVKYIGQSVNPKKRYNAHINSSKKSTNTKKKAWIKGLLNNDLIPVLTIIDKDTVNNIDVLERNYILLYKSFGANLYNLTNGGELFKTVSNETKEKLRNHNLGKVQSVDTIAKRISKLKGKSLSKEHRNKISETQIGIKNSMYGKDKSKQIIAMQEARVGKKHSEISKDKIRLAHSKPIVQLSLDDEFIKEWASAQEVENILGYSNSAINSVCNKAVKSGYVRKTAYGFKWKFKKDYENN